MSDDTRTSPVVLTISGSDPSGGAGLQADLKTFARHGVFGTSAVSLVTVQNTVGVERVELLDPELVVAQARAVLDDLPVAAVKTGSLGSAGTIRAVAELVAGLDLPLVVDPVLVSKHGHDLADDAAAEAFREHLLPRATLATPNRHEARRLVPAAAEEGREPTAAELAALGARGLLVTGGRPPAEAGEAGGVGGPLVDRLVDPGGGERRFEHRAVPSRSTHGTGCTLSAAIAAQLARGLAPEDAVERAILYVVAAIETAPRLGRGVGPLDFDAPVELDPPR